MLLSKGADSITLSASFLCAKKKCLTNKEIIIDPGTMEKGYKDSDGEEHWVEDLELID